LLGFTSKNQEDWHKSRISALIAEGRGAVPVIIQDYQDITVSKELFQEK
jgi:hypothetical protein